MLDSGVPPLQRFGGEGSFLSLKWKVWAVLSTALVLGNVGVGYLVYWRVTEQFQAEQIDRQMILVREFNAVISKEFDSISSIASFIAMLPAASRDPNITREEDRIVSILAEHGAMLGSEWRIEGLHYFPSYQNAESAVSWPDGRDPPAVGSLLERVAEKKSAGAQLVCQSDCIQVVAIALPQRGPVMGLLLIERSVSDSLGQFHLLSGADVVLLQPPGPPVAREAKQALPWGLSVVGSTHGGTITALLESLAQRHHLGDIGERPRQFEFGGEWYGVFAMPAMPVAEGLKVLLFSRVTEQVYAMHEAIVDSMLLGFGGLLFSGLLMFAVLSGPIQRIRDLIRLLPMLVDRSDANLRLEFPVAARDRFLRDEIDMITDEIGSVVSRIERLDRAKASTALALQESERKLQLAQSVAYVAGWTGCPTEGAFEVDQGAIHISPVLRHVSTWIEFLGFVHPEDRVNLVKAWRGGLPGGKMDVEFRLLIGKTEVAVHAVAEFGAIGRDRVLRAVGMMHAISRRHDSQHGLPENRGCLETEVRRRFAELITARNEAERLARAKGQFLANMSHEIRTPLNAVLGLSQIGVARSCSPSTLAIFEQILDAGEHLLGVVNDVLDLSKIEAGKLAIQQEPFDLRKVVRQCTEMFRQLIEAKGLEMKLLVQSDVPERLIGDAFRLRQILLNLLSNAVKFTSRGFVELAVCCEAGDYCFSVKDTGIGISHDDITRLFVPFHQAADSGGKGPGGTGLGLSICHALATTMGGEIRLKSVMGSGSQFMLRLPLIADVQDPAPCKSRPRGTRPLAGLRVLVADDAPVNRKVATALLEANGAQVKAVEDGGEAVHAVLENTDQAFDVLLMDLEMPCVDGREATRQIRAAGVKVPIIGLTAHVLPEERDMSIAAGMQDQLSKPVVEDELVEKVLCSIGPVSTTPAANSPAQKTL